MLEQLIPSKTRVKLLTLFLLNPGREMYLREVGRLTGENLNAVRRELANLEGIGLLSSTRRGNAHYYTVNRSFPLYEELTSMILKTEGVAKVIAGHLDGIGAIDSMFIFGSFARSEAGAGSDIDLFIVGTVDEARLIVAVREAEEVLGREINYVLFTKDEMERRIAAGDPFVANVLAGPKVVLIGEG
ncbi:nucleotidyltransferase domain-containing protein [Methanofollis tationis]|uniref:Nucleotidyltransferase domain-containing protein n=1 Tax=Methanofollis tationis TaxID=81417 RepID=A0A7K4HN89_9EURY|nr:nucleotidyltransferase domain-containing protein [Methanofollis tationis]NVO66743.1 nucleotidyltransferase domain-containing protein [Methanofollis tationis]